MDRWKILNFKKFFKKKKNSLNSCGESMYHSDSKTVESIGSSQQLKNLYSKAFLVDCISKAAKIKCLKA